MIRYGSNPFIVGRKDQEASETKPGNEMT